MVLVGSCAFFSSFEDFSSKDKDYVQLFTDSPFKRDYFRLHNDKEDIFYYKDWPKEWFIENTLSRKKDAMIVGKFLVKEFADQIGFTIDDLKLFDEMFNNLDDRHSYEKVIYDAYIENGEYRLTQEQLENAYDIYKKYKKK